MRLTNEEHFAHVLGIWEMINAPSSKAIRLQYVPNDHRLQFMQTVDAKAYTISTEEKSINLKYSKVTLATTADSTDASCECSRQ